MEEKIKKEKILDKIRKIIKGKVRWVLEKEFYHYPW